MKLHQKLFFVLVLLLPTQLGCHFWPKFSYVYGLKIDYLAPTIYLTDILIFLILLFWFLEKRKKLTISKELLAILFYLFLNSFFAQNQGAAFWKFLKIIEFTLLGLYIIQSKINLLIITDYLSVAVIWSSLVGTLQFIKKESLGGVFWLFGERNFGLGTPGIAKVSIFGRTFLRSYSTFSHPNSLAGFILASLILISGRKK